MMLRLAQFASPWPARVRHASSPSMQSRTLWFEFSSQCRIRHQVDNRPHWVRDFTYEEGRCRVYVGNIPQNLAAISNRAISLIRLDGRFDFVPPVGRHSAARPQEALDGVMPDGCPAHSPEFAPRGPALGRARRAV